MPATANDEAALPAGDAIEAGNLLGQLRQRRVDHADRAPRAPRRPGAVSAEISAGKLARPERDQRRVRHADRRRAQPREQRQVIVGIEHAAHQRARVDHLAALVVAATALHRVGNPRLAQRVQVDLEVAPRAHQHAGVLPLEAVRLLQPGEIARHRLGLQPGRLARSRAPRPAGLRIPRPRDPMLHERARRRGRHGLALALLGRDQRLEGRLIGPSLRHRGRDRPLDLVEDRGHRAAIHAQQRGLAAGAERIGRPGRRRRADRPRASRRSTAWGRRPGTGPAARRHRRRARAGARCRTAPGRCPGTRRRAADRSRSARARAPPAARAADRAPRAAAMRNRSLRARAARSRARASSGCSTRRARSRRSGRNGTIRSTAAQQHRGGFRHGGRGVAERLRLRGIEALGRAPLAETLERVLRTSARAALPRARRARRRRRYSRRARDPSPRWRPPLRASCSRSRTRRCEASAVHRREAIQRGAERLEPGTRCARA